MDNAESLFRLFFRVSGALPEAVADLTIPQALMLIRKGGRAIQQSFSSLAEARAALAERNNG